MRVSDRLFPIRWLGLKACPRSAPSGPAPWIGIAREAVGITGMQLCGSKCAAVHGSNALIGFVALQQFRDEWEEAGVCNAVVFQDDARALMLEEPINGTADGGHAPLVLVKKSTLHGARPAWCKHGFTHSGHFACFAHSFRARPVTRHVQARRASSGNRSHGALHQVWAIEADK